MGLDVGGGAVVERSELELKDLRGKETLPWEVVKTTEMVNGGKGIRVGSVCQKMAYVPQEIRGRCLRRTRQILRLPQMFVGISKVRDVVFSPTHK